MFRNNIIPLSPIPEEGNSQISPCNVRKNDGGREDNRRDSTETDISSCSVVEHGEDVDASEEDEEQTASESVAETTDGSPEVGSLSPEDLETPEAMRRQRKSRLTDIFPFGGREHSVVKDVTPPAAVLAMDLSGAAADSPNSPLEGPVAASSPYQRPSLSQESDSSLPELIIEVEKKRCRHDSDSEEFFNRLEKTMGKLARKYILNEEDDTWSFDSGVQIFESTSRNYLDDQFTEGNFNGKEAGQNVERVATDIRAESKDASGMIDHTKNSEEETSEVVERSKRSVLKDITPLTRKLTMPRFADEDMMQTPDDYTDHYVHSDRGISMRSSGVIEEEQSSNDEALGQDMEEHASESPIEGELDDEEDDDKESLEEAVERSESDTPTEATGELEAEKQSYRNVPEEEVERSVLEGESEEEDSNEEKPVQNMETSASDGLTVPTYYFDEEEQDSSEEEPALKVERSTSYGPTVATGKLDEDDESNAETSQEAREQRASESHAVATDARKEPEILSSPDIWVPEAMRRRRSSKITMISPVEKSKNSEFKDSTPPARTLSMQRITDEGLILLEELFGEEKADIGEEAQEEENQTTAASFERTSYASPILDAAPSKHIQRKSSLEDIGNYLESSNRNTHTQKMKRMPIRGIKAGADTERSFKRRRLSANRQSKEATDLDEIVPFYPDGDSTGSSNENRKDSVEASISPATTPTKGRVSPIISTGGLVTRRKATKARTAPMPQTCSPLPELNIETAKKYPEADSDSEEFFNRLERTMTKLARKYILKIEDDTESFDSGVQEFERLLSLEDCLDSDDD